VVQRFKTVGVGVRDLVDIDLGLRREAMRH
jgi:hypothetical protein